MSDNKTAQVRSVVSAFHKSSHSDGGGNCVEVAKATFDVTVAGKVATTFPMYVVRDSKNPSVPAQWYTAAEWAAFMRGIKDGEFD
jgi:hypothetical protein